VTDFLKRVLLLMVGGGQKHDKEPKTCKEVGYCVSMTQQISYTVREKSRSVLDTIRGCDEISDVSSDSHHVDVVGIRDAGPLDQRDRRLGVRMWGCRRPHRDLHF
jgi:hypothetical protein